MELEFERKIFPCNKVDLNCMKEILWNVKDISLKRGEYVIERNNLIEDPLAHPNVNGCLFITNMRTIWYDKGNTQSNLCIGHDSVMSVVSRPQGISSILHSTMMAGCEFPMLGLGINLKSSLEWERHKPVESSVITPKTTKSSSQDLHSKENSVTVTTTRSTHDQEPSTFEAQSTSGEEEQSRMPRSNALTADISVSESHPIESQHPGKSVREIETKDPVPGEQRTIQNVSTPLKSSYEKLLLVPTTPSLGGEHESPQTQSKPEPFQATGSTRVAGCHGSILPGLSSDLSVFCLGTVWNAPGQNELRILARSNFCRFEFAWRNMDLLDSDEPLIFRRFVEVMQAFHSAPGLRESCFHHDIFTGSKLNLLPGEKLVKRVDGVFNLKQSRGHIGEFHLTSARVVWVSAGKDKKVNGSIPLMNLEGIQIGQNELGAVLILAYLLRHGHEEISTLQFQCQYDRLMILGQVISSLKQRFVYRPVIGIEDKFPPPKEYEADTLHEKLEEWNQQFENTNQDL